ncbi:MAG: helix-turn-helix transcriptional regulator [Clostridia bacterium]|nr:helix-turn-helix transcriptional regulator [Clostridia bacterium]
MKKYFKHKLENLIHVSKIVTIHYFEFEKNFKSTGESHDFWEIVYADRESVVCTADAQNIPLLQGEILFHKPNEFHTLSANGQKAPNVFILSFVCKSDAMQFFENKKFRLDKNLARFIYFILEEGKKTFDIPYSDPKIKKMALLPQPTLGGEQLIKNYLEILLINLLRVYTETESGNDIFLQRNDLATKPVHDVILLLQNSLQQSLSINEICKKTAYGRAYLFRVFKAATGKTIMEYYLTLKIERAKQLLRENELTVKEISATLAFNEPNYFTKTFKRFTGLTPSAYKRRAMQL